MESMAGSFALINRYLFLKFRLGNNMYRKNIFSAFLFLLLLNINLSITTVAEAQAVKEADEAKASIEKLLVRYRRAAAEANAEEFFGCLDPDGIFFGTDETERFTLSTLKSTFGPYFEKGIGWKREVLERQVYVGPNNQMGWFEEKSKREGMPMRTTGVVRNTDNGWKIIQYNTSFSIPNEIIPQLTELVLKTK